MSNPKRKVTDLLPSEAIRVSPNQDGRVFDIEPIPTESDEVEVSDDKIDWYKKLLAKLKRIESGELSLSEYIEQIELKTRNTPNQ